MKALAAAALLLLAPSVRAQDAPESVAAPERDPAVVELRDRLKSDPAAADAVAERLSRSNLLGQAVPGAGEAARLKAAREWIAEDPGSAARVALGLARDDARGRPDFERALLRQARASVGANPGAEKNLFGRLRRTARDSRLLKKQADDVSEDEKRELLRTMFEGKGAQTEKTVGMKEDGKTPEKAAAPATSFNGYYDRLSAGNLRGYSPQLLALQSALNARRPPGAPALVETGKLDFPTLSYPAYGMDYDVKNLAARLRLERVQALARLAGRELTARDQQNPDLEAQLAAAVPAAKLPPRLARRAALAARARAALAAFSAAAAKSKDPDAVTRGLLVELGRRQKEAARWIAAAALEEELSRVDEMDGFLTPELTAAIDAAPVAAPVRDAYKRRGAALKASIARLKAGAEKALGLLQSDAWLDALAEVDRLVAQNQTLKRTLGRDLDDYARVPFMIAEARAPQPRWRRILDDLAMKWAPGLAYSRGVASRRERLARALHAFAAVASGAPRP